MQRIPDLSQVARPETPEWPKLEVQMQPNGVLIGTHLGPMTAFNQFIPWAIFEGIWAEYQKAKHADSKVMQMVKDSKL